jgi:hypothetical protein
MGNMIQKSKQAYHWTNAPKKIHSLEPTLTQ